MMENTDDEFLFDPQAIELGIEHQAAEVKHARRLAAAKEDKQEWSDWWELSPSFETETEVNN